MKIKLTGQTRTSGFGVQFIELSCGHWLNRQHFQHQHKEKLTTGKGRLIGFCYHGCHEKILGA